MLNASIIAPRPNAFLLRPIHITFYGIRILTILKMMANMIANTMNIDMYIAGAPSPAFCNQLFKVKNKSLNAFIGIFTRSNSESARKLTNTSKGYRISILISPRSHWKIGKLISGTSSMPSSPAIAKSSRIFESIEITLDNQLF